jgi:23S rRNA (guanosine2251-2'-O)-methyltransferase
VARRPALRLLVVPNRRQALEKIVLHATSLRIPIVEIEGGSLTAVAGFDGHQGVALVVRPRAWATVDEVLALAAERGEPPFVLALDSLEDPQNVGTLLRSAEAVGAHGVLFPTHRQAPLSPAAIKASAGATEHLLLVPVDDLPGTLADLHVRGIRIAGADEDAPLTAREADLRGPIALVVGSEGQGLGPAVRRRTDLLVKIPMRGSIGSLNAAVAGSILLFDILAQRLDDLPPVAPPVSFESIAEQPAVEAPAEAPTPADESASPAATDDQAPPSLTKRTRARRPAADSTASTLVEAIDKAAAPAPPKLIRTRKATADTAASTPPAPAPPKRTRTRKATAEPPAQEAALTPESAAAVEGESPPKKRTRTRRTAPAATPDDDLLPGGPPVQEPSSEASDLA